MTKPEAHTSVSAAEEAVFLAHDLRNLLTTVQGHADLQLAAHASDQGLARSLDAISVAAGRAAALCDGLLACAAAEREEASSFTLGELVNSAVCVFASRCEDPVTLTRDSDESISVVGRRMALERALLNLLWNAHDASTGSAEIEICWGAAVSDGSGAAWLEVRDRGCGIPAGGLGDLIQAFRSTKASGGEVRGLGLTSVLEAMALQGGGLTARNRADGQGACFRMVFADE
ncbi:MAG: HAMP domain-containing histidine kinase [Planctomycetes bacterium]|jgi:signal transduction histidine kinase|nr:HAMP domain-containing histidine kinase [Planctomycetota bacterium]MBT4029068.1 HAMP domain-containing histidine kinase [Planctomycetota bacterium]MBT4560312.1 HAMP domain-containing histidine kinase [Planctomycetota bacterium]MBT5101777.1 HAMP domain-containing histidine kinase [Planctomycetota bacterium]MBT7012005.1 HAMP domain-containing histidine kinase [Planctomycetota bacterium]